MALKVIISHKTIYKYDRKVSLSPHIFRLRPAPHSRTPIESYSIRIKPDNQFFNWQQDPFGNYLARLVFPDKTDEMSVDVQIVADLKTINPFDFFVEKYAENFPFEYETNLKKELLPYLEMQESGKLLDDWLSTVDKTPRKINDFLVEINQQLNKYLSYTIRLEPGVQSCEETIQRKSGSCRDFAWLMVQTFRHLGFAARFVSGYLVQLTSDIESLDGPSGPKNDFTDLHAWTEVYIPGAGWIGLDSTSGLFAGEGHIPLACTPHYESAAPVSGFTDICNTEFFYDNTVKRIFESPRVTKPYTEEQWNDIYNLGFAVEEDLQKMDVRLTMGGEPTFVSIDDMESPQWNTEADGKHKRLLANNLTDRLLSKYANQGLLHHGMGKWYPGEELPRWQFGIYWRKDGKPIWTNQSLLARNTMEYKIDNDLAIKFIKNLTKYLGITDKTIIPAFEDIYYFMWENENLPEDVDPLKDDLNDSLVKKKLSELLQIGLEKPAGFVMPLNWSDNKWITSNWSFKRKALFLSPGNSPMGFRLPLKSLITKPDLEAEPVIEKDLFDETCELENYSNKVNETFKNKIKNKNGGIGDEFVRTAICAEVRNSKLYIFLPPVSNIEIFLELISAIEATANQLNIPILLEGYEPPHDNRIEKIKITPDPGVIEVNVQPAHNWSELVENTLSLYEEARQSRLGTEKFMLDGRHTGTGGGNHVTIGGTTPADSALLRNPELLRSLITFWQHHPGLSYLFSGAFIGPTSQAPRVDEGRHENLYELEIAFGQIPENQEVPYWLTDRLFRNLLTDITGNTHRAEFCIDKLYSPDSSSGRLGILELRAFDMPPHARMSLLQMLLVRTLVAWFWKKPYKHKLIRWGTELHDKFLMEHYVKEDITDICNQLSEAGYPFKTEWFDPFFEFRFPLYGIININGILLDLRMAIEPWNVLGEEMTGRGTARYVDSSVERVQIKVNNFIEDRYVLTCNSVKIPLSPTGKKGEFVASVRYKAWQPWSALHPTIGVDTPLVFDLVDLWNQRSIGGCTYFVSHPGGLSYSTYPVNSYEAESRRINRFWELAQPQQEMVPTEFQPVINTVGRYIEPNYEARVFKVKEIPANLEFPHTLDLRQSKKMSE